MHPANRTRRRLLKGAAAVVPAAALGGCAATPYGPYYRPSSGHPDATLKGAWCSGLAGPKTVIELALAPDVILTARAERAHAERDRPELPLRLTLSLPPAQPARFASARLRIAELGSGTALGGEPEIVVFRHATLPADAWIDPVRVRPSGTNGVPVRAGERHGSASVRVSMEPGFAPERLRLDGLAIAREGGSVTMPAVTMSRPASGSSPRDYRSAELDAELQERAAACRRETPKLACGNIVEHSSLSFSTEDSGGHWAGRWYVSGDGPRARIEGDVNFALRAPGAWRVASDTLTVRDAAGNGRSARFSRVQLALNDRISLDTSLFTGPVDGTGSARVSIEVRLPAAPADFEVVLPDLHLGSRPIAIPPIRFGRRTFDGGIEPFNC